MNEASTLRYGYQKRCKGPWSLWIISEVDEQRLISLVHSKLKHGTPYNRESWVSFFDELGEETSKQASHGKLGHEILKFASDLKHAPNDKAERALHSLNAGQVS